MSAFRDRLWRGEAPVASALLSPLSWAYGLGASVDRARKVAKRERAPVPVISIGNLVVGGAGKTPVTLEIAKRLQGKGIRVAIVSRGYGRRTRGLVLVSDGERVLATADEGGDEPRWLALRASGAIVIASENRAEGAREAARRGAEVVLLDDGFSHHALEREADIVVVDHELRFGNGRLLPAGPLREPLSALSRASLVWLSRAPSPDAPSPCPELPIPLVRSAYQSSAIVDLRSSVEADLETLRSTRVLAVCGIARPDGFRRSLESVGAEVAEMRAFGDHHAFTKGEVESLVADARRLGCARIVTTEKDAMRLQTLTDDGRFVALRMQLEVLGDASPLDALLARVMSGKERAA